MLDVRPLRVRRRLAGAHQPFAMEAAMEARQITSPAQRRSHARWGVITLTLLLSALSASAVQISRELGTVLMNQEYIGTRIHDIGHLQNAAMLLVQSPPGTYSPRSQVVTDAALALRQDLKSMPPSSRYDIERAGKLIRTIVRPSARRQTKSYIRRQQNELLLAINPINAQLQRSVTLAHKASDRALHKLRWWGTAFGVVLLVTLTVFLLRLFVQAASQRHVVKDMARELQRDPLTGWANRAVFIDAIDRGLSQASRSARHAGILFLDLDRFKIINDRFGHAAGDEVLRQITGRFSTVIRAGDLPARVGGDELAIFMPDLPDDAAAAELARRLVACLNDPITVNGLSIHAGLSVGIAIFPANGHSAAELLNAADQAMYRAKRQGGGYAYYTAAVTAQVVRQRQLARDLHRAVGDDQLFCIFQPIFDAKTHYPVAVEALARWRHPDLGIVAPGDWISLAKRADLLAGFTPIIFEHALKELPSWKKLGWFPRVSINLSAVECLNPDLPAIISDALQKFCLKGSDVELEMTDNLLALPAAIKTIMQLKKLGVGLVMDDTSGGYPSLPAMHRLPLDRVKVDRTGIGSLAQSSSALELLAAFVALAHRMQLQVIAEGIETEAQASAILSANCDLLQGHYYAPAQDADLLRRRIEQLAIGGQPTFVGG